MSARGVNPVSNKLGLTLVNPTTTGASAATQNETPGRLTSTYGRRARPRNTTTHTRSQTHGPYHVLAVCWLQAAASVDGSGAAL